MDQRQRITRSTDGFFISTRAYEGQPAQKLHNSEGKSAIAFTMTMFCTVRKSGTSSLQWPNFYNWKPAQSVLQHSCFWKPTNPWIHLPSLLSLLPFLCWFRSIAHLRLVWWSKKGNIRQYQFLLLFHSKKLYCFLSFFFFSSSPSIFAGLMTCFDSVAYGRSPRPLGSMAVSTFLLEANHHAESSTSLKLQSWEETQAMRRKPHLIPDT